ncbi:MAG: PilZ domain-containing protein [Planctomycetota bacterium]
MADRRRVSRTPVAGLRTGLGQVMDLSPTGAALFCKGKLAVAVGDALSLTLRRDGDALEVAAKVVRIEPVGLFRHEVAVAFDATSAEVSAGVARLIAAAERAPAEAPCSLAG